MLNGIQSNLKRNKAGRMNKIIIELQGFYTLHESQTGMIILQPSL